MSSINILASLTGISRKTSLAMLVFLMMSGMGMAQGKKGSDKPLVVFVTGDHEYSSEATMPIIAAELEKTMDSGPKC